MEKKTKQAIKNFTLEVLDAFLGIPEALIMVFDRKEFYRIMRGCQTEKYLTCQNISKFISNSKQSGYIKVEKHGGQESIIFTNKARLAVVDRIASRSAIDDKLHFVSFDIPEEKRLSRNQFRRAIKRLGFRQIQKSLWVCNKSVGDLVEMAAVEYGVGEYVLYLTSDNTNINNAIGKILK